MAVVYKWVVNFLEFLTHNRRANDTIDEVLAEVYPEMKETQIPEEKQIVIQDFKICKND